MYDEYIKLLTNPLDVLNESSRRDDDDDDEYDEEKEETGDPVVSTFDCMGINVYIRRKISQYSKLNFYVEFPDYSAISWGKSTTLKIPAGEIFYLAHIVSEPSEYISYNNRRDLDSKLEKFIRSVLVQTITGQKFLSYQGPARYLEDTYSLAQFFSKLYDGIEKATNLIDASNRTIEYNPDSEYDMDSTSSKYASDNEYSEYNPDTDYDTNSSSIYKELPTEASPNKTPKIAPLAKKPTTKGKK